MKRYLLLLLLLPCLVMTYGCPAILAGATAGAGAYTYVKGDLKRTYQAPFDKTIEASLDALKSLRIKITEEPSGDAIKSIIRAERSDGTPIVMALTMTTINVTEVSIRSGRTGFFDKNVSELIHANIEKRLQ